MMAELKFEILEGLPPYGPLAQCFSRSGLERHSEGLVVRFFPDNGESWVGNFQPGLGGIDTVLEHPNKRDCIVIARGQGYVIDPTTHHCTEVFGAIINITILVSELSAVVFGNGLDFEAIAPSGQMWRSKRISYDGFRNLSQEGLVLFGEAWSAPGDYWRPFALDLKSGDFTGGSYPNELA